MNTNTHTFGDRLKFNLERLDRYNHSERVDAAERLRLDQHVTWTDVSRDTGININSLLGYKDDKARPPYRVVQLLARYFRDEQLFVYWDVSYTKALAFFDTYADDPDVSAVLQQAKDAAESKVKGSGLYAYGA